MALLDVLMKTGATKQVVGRNVEETLDLPGMRST